MQSYGFLSSLQSTVILSLETRTQEINQCGVTVTHHNGRRAGPGQTWPQSFTDRGSQRSDHLAQAVEFFNLLVRSSWLTITLSAGPSSLVILQGKVELIIYTQLFLLGL